MRLAKPDAELVVKASDAENSRHLQQTATAGSEDATDFPEGFPGVIPTEMLDDAVGENGVERAVAEGKAAGVANDEMCLQAELPRGTIGPSCSRYPVTCDRRREAGEVRGRGSP